MGNGDEEIDRSLENLIEMDGDTYVIDEAGHWVKFQAKRVACTPERPQGIQYSLTLHDIDNQRLVGFDNAHPAPIGRGPAARRNKRCDHRHRLESIKPYQYQNAERLIEDFWKAVDQILDERRGKR